MEVFVVYELLDQQHGDSAQASVSGVFSTEDAAWADAKSSAEYYVSMANDEDNCEMTKHSSGYTVNDENDNYPSSMEIEIKKMTIDKEGG